MKGKCNFSPLNVSSQLFLAALLLALLVSGTALGNSGYVISWWSVDDGGGLLTGGNYILIGTAGQYDASTSEHAQYTVAGGFWGTSSTIHGQEGEQIYLPTIMNSEDTSAVSANVVADEQGNDLRLPIIGGQ